MNMHPPKLQQLLSGLKGIKSVDGPLDVLVAGVVSDSRRVTRGSVFVALRGACHDGRDHVAEALERGAVAVVSDAPVMAGARFARVLVEDARAAMAFLASKVHGCPSEKMLMIGVVGSSGTASVAWLIQHMLAGDGRQTGLISTIQHSVGDRVFPSRAGSPGADDLQEMLARMVRNGCRACVVEISPQALEQRRVWSVAFDIIVHTRFRPGTGPAAECPVAFQEFWTSLGAGSKKICGVVNIDDSAGRGILGKGRVSLRVAYGLSAEADIQAEEIVCSDAGISMRIKTPGLQWECALPLLGRSSVYNVLGAVGAGVALKLPPQTIRRSLERAGRVPGRLENLDCGQSFGVVVDDAHEAESLRETLGTLREVVSGRILLVFGSGGGLKPDHRIAMGEVAAAHANFAWITNDNPRRECPELIAAQLKAGFLRGRESGVSVVLDRQKAIFEAIEAALPGDLVIIAGKGNEKFQQFEDTVVPFDDRFYAREALNDLGYGKGKKVTRCGLQSEANTAQMSRSLQPATSNPLA